MSHPKLLDHLAISLLEILYDRQAHSLVSLQQQTAYSIADIRQVKAELQRRGVSILEANDHYQLISPLPLLDHHFLSSSLAPNQVYIRAAIGSTNQYMLDHAASLNKGDLCLSEYQLQGRGRRGKHWASVFGGQINMSLYWTFEYFNQIEGLSLAVGVSVIKALHSMGCNLSLKWPNDILLLGKKVGGILIEVCARDKTTLGLVVGIGLNLALPKQLQQDHAYWTDLSQVDPPIEKNQLIITLVDYLREDLRVFEKKGFASFRNEWLQYDYYLGKKIKLQHDKQGTVGIEKGVTEEGALSVLTSNGLQYFQGGEISLTEA